MQTVFVTGASGFIGGHLVSELTRRGAHVKCLVRSMSGVDQFPVENVELVRGSLEAPDTYQDAIEACDTVFHVAGLIAAILKDQLFEVNGLGCGVLAKACASVSNPPRLVYVSSVSAAGPPLADKDIREEADAPTPISNYGRSKRFGELELQKQAGRLPITVVRPGIVYGPGDRTAATIFRSIYRSHLHMVIGFRTPPLALIYVGDLVQLVLRAAERGETLLDHPDGDFSPQGYYFACDDSEFPNYWEFGQRIAKSMDRRVFVWPLWRWVGFSLSGAFQTLSRLQGRPTLVNTDKIQEAMARSWACTSEKARKQLGFSPSEPLDVRLKQTAQWYDEHGWL
jgi:nucleoside-diphosphate-sugar epimerase